MQKQTLAEGLEKVLRGREDAEPVPPNRAERRAALAMARKVRAAAARHRHEGRRTGLQRKLPRGKR